MFESNNLFDRLEPIQPNAIQQAANKFQSDPRPTDHEDPERNKYNLGQGHLYNPKPQPDEVDLDGNPINQKVGDIFNMASVNYAENLYNETRKTDPNRNAYGGPKDSTTLALEPLVRKVLFGPNSPLSENGVATIPILGLADGFALTWELIKNLNPELDTVITGTNGYGAYKAILKRAFDGKVVYYNHGTPERNFDMDGFTETLKSADPKKTVVFLQAAGYNFSAINPTPEEKLKMVKLLAEKGFFTIIDSAYQGLIEGLTIDADLPRMLARETDLPFMVIDSWSKKAQLYGLRVSFAHLITRNEESAQLARANMYAIIRELKLCQPPLFKIIFHLLNDPAVLKRWLERDLPDARGILTQTRKDLAIKMGSEHYAHIATGLGMFEKLDISHEGVDYLAKKHHIYTVKASDEENLVNGSPAQVARANMGGIPKAAVSHIAGALKDALEKFPSLEK